MLYKIAFLYAQCVCVFKSQDKEIRDKLSTIPVFLITNGEGNLVAIGTGPGDELASYAFLAHDVADAVRSNLQKQQPAGTKPLAVAFAPLGAVWESLAAAPSTVKRRRPQIRFLAIAHFLMQQRVRVRRTQLLTPLSFALGCRRCLSSRAGTGTPARRAHSCASWPTTRTSRPRARARPRSARWACRGGWSPRSTRAAWSAKTTPIPRAAASSRGSCAPPTAATAHCARAVAWALQKGRRRSNPLPCRWRFRRWGSSWQP